MPFANDCLESGYQSLRDVPELTLDQCTEGTLRFTINDPRTGSAIDLTQYGLQSDSSSSSSSGAEFTGLKLIMKEMPWSKLIWQEKALDIIDAAGGVAELVYDTNKITRRSGVWTAEIQIIENGIIRRILPYFVIINPTLTGARQDSRSTLSIAEIRMTIRDTSPAGNFLIDELDFKENEIALAIRRCIDYWNEARPPVMTNMTPVSFPWRYHLSLGVVGELHHYAAINKMRNDLPYSAAGVSVQDTVRWERYKMIGDEYTAQWRQWVKEKKYEININGAFRTMGSAYYYGFFPR